MIAILRDNQPGPGSPRRAVRLLGRSGRGLPRGGGTRFRRDRNLRPLSGCDRGGRDRGGRPASAAEGASAEAGGAGHGRRLGARTGSSLAHADPEVRRRAREFIRGVHRRGRPIRTPGDHRLDARTVGRGRHARGGARPSGRGARRPRRAMPGDRGTPLLFEPLNRYETNWSARSTLAANCSAASRPTMCGCWPICFT